MLGLYVHIPFCARRCPYCDFAIHVGGDAALQEAYLAALFQELRSTLRAHVKESTQPVSTIFCGGGTPTALGATRLNELLRLIRDEAPVAEDAEISLEGNPEDGDGQAYEVLLAGGWNRLSLGVQSFDDAVLKTLGRRHSAQQATDVVQAARRAGWQNISFDLIYSVPGQSLASWQSTLEAAMKLQTPHLSCYSLTIEPETAFARRVERGRMTPVNDDAQAEFMNLAQSTLGAGGWGRYEVSNYAQPGRECRHNLHYWVGGDYLAAGCGAHGHQQGRRWWNERATPRYIELMEAQGSAVAGQEVLSAVERLEERVLLGMRLRNGFDLHEVSQQVGLDARSLLKPRLQELAAQGVLCLDDERVCLNSQWLAMADAVTRRVLADLG